MKDYKKEAEEFYNANWNNYAVNIPEAMADFATHIQSEVIAEIDEMIDFEERVKGIGYPYTLKALTQLKKRLEEKK